MSAGWVLERTRAVQSAAREPQIASQVVTVEPKPLCRPRTVHSDGSGSNDGKRVRFILAGCCGSLTHCRLMAHLHAIVNLLNTTVPYTKQQQQQPLRYRFTEKHCQQHGRYQLPHHQTQQQQQQQQHAQPHTTARVLQPKHRALAARLAAAAERQQRRQQFAQQQQQQLQDDSSTSTTSTTSRHGVWSSKVAADIRVVCQELKLPQSVAAALCAAASKGHISCNPGILLSQVSSLVVSVVVGVRVEHSRGSCLSTAHMQCASRCSNALRARACGCWMCAHVSQCSVCPTFDPPVSCRPQLVRLLPLEPQLAALLGTQPQQQDNTTPSSSSNNTSSSSLSVLLRAQPTLLAVDPLSLQANCQHLQQLLGQQAAAAAVKRCPQVLNCSPFR